MVFQRKDPSCSVTKVIIYSLHPRFGKHMRISGLDRFQAMNIKAPQWQNPGAGSTHTAEECASWVQNIGAILRISFRLPSVTYRLPTRVGGDSRAALFRLAGQLGEPYESAIQRRSG